MRQGDETPTATALSPARNAWPFSTGLSPSTIEVIEVTHTCLQDKSVAPTYLLSWSALSDIGALELLNTWDAIEESDWPAFLLRIEPAPEEDFSTHTLAVEAHGQGLVLALPLHADENGYAFNHHSHGLALQDSVTVSAGALMVNLDAATIATPLGELMLDSATLTLDGYASLNE